MRKKRKRLILHKKCIKVAFIFLTQTHMYQQEPLLIGFTIKLLTVQLLGLWVLIE